MEIEKTSVERVIVLCGTLKLMLEYAKRHNETRQKFFSTGSAIALDLEDAQQKTVHDHHW
jgi:hypothetical protein